MTKAVSPTTAAAGAMTTLTYTITVNNRDDEDEGLNKLHDELAAGLTYDAGSGAFTPPGGGATGTEPGIAWCRQPNPRSGMS